MVMLIYLLLIKQKWLIIFRSNRSRGVQKTLYTRFNENSMKNGIDLIFLGYLKFAKSLYRVANRFLANLETIR
jgi:hypothetical protein